MKTGKINSLFNFLDKEMNLRPLVVNFEINDKEIFCIEVSHRLLEEERYMIQKIFEDLVFLEKETIIKRNKINFSIEKMEIKLGKEIIDNFDGTLILDKDLIKLDKDEYKKIEKLWYWSLDIIDSYYEDLL